MIRVNNITPDGGGPSEGGRSDDSPPHASRPSRKPRGIPSTTPEAGREMAFLNPAQVAEMWGISHDKVLEFIRTGELEAFNVASRKSRRPQFKIPLAALQAFQERRSGRDPARSSPQPSSRRASRKSSSPTGRDYF